MTKAMSRGEARRRRKMNALQEPVEGPAERQLAVIGIHAPETTAPTPERAARGTIVPAEKDKPALALDPLALMLKHKGITEAQENAGRTYAELAFIAQRSMGIRQPVSCLAGGIGAYDSDDGAARAEREWFIITTMLPAASRAYLDRTVIDGEIPRTRFALGHVLNALRMLVKYWG